MGRHNRRKRNQQQESKNKIHNEISSTKKVEERKERSIVGLTEPFLKTETPKCLPDLNSNHAINKFDSNAEVPAEASTSSSRDYYLHYLCHICKTIPKNCERVNCSKCKLVTYCSIEHKREHWPSHADMCEALADIFRDIDFEGISPEIFRKIRVEIINKCQVILERSLEKWEREIILYHNRCHVCYKRDESVLESCSICKHISFCKNHPIGNEHPQHCLSLVLYKSIVLRILTNNPVTIYFPETFSEEFKHKDMKSFCNEVADGELESVFLSEIATAPLSVLFALKTVYGADVNPPQSLCVHFIGAENDFELNVIEKWETFLAHYLSCEELLLVFIGPELFYDNNTMYKMCEQCEANNKKMSMIFYSNVLYHDYATSSEFIKPNLICSFNPGFYRTTGFNNTDTWQETIFQILRQNVPVLTTEYTKVEILNDIQRIEKQSKLTFSQQPRLNPFSSLKPFLSFVYDEATPVIFKNYYSTILQAQRTQLN